MAVRDGVMKSFVLLMALSHATAAPRPAPELTLRDLGGREITLDGYRGKVVVVAFLSTACPHCQMVSRELEGLYVDLGQQGLRVMGGVFNEGADAAEFARRFGLIYPIGAVPRSTVERFMGIAQGSRIGTPQLAVVDRGGMIRAQSEAKGSPLLQQADVLRSLVIALLKVSR